MSLCFKLWSNIHDIAFTSRAILTCVHFSNGEYLLSIVQPVEFFIPRVLKQYTLAYLNLAINTADAKIADPYFTDKKPEMRCTETKKKVMISCSFPHALSGIGVILLHCPSGKG